MGSGPVCINFMRWSKAGVWPMIFNTLAADADTEWVMIDSTLVRAHPHAAGARKVSKPGLRTLLWWIFYQDPRGM